MSLNNADRYRLSANFNEVPCVYVYFNALGHAVYVGETDNLKRRTGEHAANTSHAMHMYGPVSIGVEIIRAGEQARRLRERQLIAYYRPPANG